MTQVLTPDVLAQAFLDRFEDYKNGSLTGPIMNPQMTHAILNSIRATPTEMISFFVQVNYLIKLGLDQAYEDPDTTMIGVMEWSNLMHSFYIPVLNNFMMSTAALMDQYAPDLLYGADDNEIPVPEMEASEVFKNIEGYHINSWITPTPEADPEQPDTGPESP